MERTDYAAYAIAAGTIYLSSQDAAEESILIAGIVGAVGGFCAFTLVTNTKNSGRMIANVNRCFIQ